MTSRLLDIYTPFVAARKEPRMPKEKRESFVKTSLKIRADLWKAAHVLALDERSELQIVVNRALEAYLRSKGRAR